MFLQIDRHDKSRLAFQEAAGDAISYGQLIADMATLAQPMLSRAVVFVLSNNNIATATGYLSFIDNGNIPLMLSAGIDEALLKALDDEYRPAYYYLPTAAVGRVKALCGGEVVTQYRGYQLIRTDYPRYPVADELALLLSTSGSTGVPKLVRHSLRNVEKSAQNVATSFRIDADERPMLELPLQYTMGLNVLNAHLYAGACGVLTEANLMSADFYKQLAEQAITSYVGVPYSYQIFDRLRFTRQQLPALKTLYVGGGKMADDLILKFANWCRESNRQFICSYGKTECTARMAFLPFSALFDKVGSIGQAIHGGQLSIVDSDGQPLTGACEGELAYRGPNVTLGYAYNRADLTKGDEWQGYHLTGDMARRDAAGYYYITGRKSRFAKLFGLRISFDQIERIVEKEYAISCACTGDDQQIKVFVTDAAIVDAARSHIAQLTGLVKTAIAVNYIAEIPVSGVGKVDYSQLTNL